MWYRDILDAQQVRLLSGPCQSVQLSLIKKVNPNEKLFSEYVSVCPQVFGKEMQVRLYAPVTSKIDPSIAVILLISIVTVVLGGLWSGACER